VLNSTVFTIDFSCSSEKRAWLVFCENLEILHVVHIAFSSYNDIQYKYAIYNTV
jgi:hypothetical protein